MKKLTQAEIKRKNAGMELVRLASTAKTLVRRKVSAGGAATISKEAGKEIDKWLQQNEHNIYGSLPTKKQMFKSREAKDIDLAVENPRATATALKRILDKKGKYPTKIIKSPGGKRYAVQVKKNGKWIDAADIHSIGLYYGNYSVYGSTLPPLNQNGLNIQKLADQLLRKANSVMAEDPATGKFGPKPERAIKDTADFINVAKMLIASKEVRAKATLKRVEEAKKAISVWERYYNSIKGRKRKIRKKPVSAKRKKKFTEFALEHPAAPVKDIVFTTKGIKHKKSTSTTKKKYHKKVVSPYSGKKQKNKRAKSELGKRIEDMTEDLFAH